MNNNFIKKALFFILLFSLLMPFLIRAITIVNPTSTTSFEDLIDAILNFIFWAAIVIAPIMVIVAAYFLLTSGGDPEKAKTAKKIILYTIIGLIIIFLAKSIPGLIRRLFVGPEELICDDGIDNDGDGTTDCFDLDCAVNPVACPCPPKICQDLRVLIASSYGEICGNPGYNPIADVDKDKKVFLFDMAGFLSKCGDGNACQTIQNNTFSPCASACNATCQSFLSNIARAYGSQCGSPDYDPAYDVNKNKIIDMNDEQSVFDVCNDANACLTIQNNTCNPCIGPCP